jgi:ubiquinone/menaquinone biosynthesis C-methylase UbiE
VDEEARRAAIEQIETAYRDYELTGRTAIWTDRDLGSQLAAEERDRWVSRSLGPLLGSTVLDLGCGEGHLASRIAEAGYPLDKYVGVDLLAARVAEASRRIPDATFIVASADRLPMPNYAFDAVVAATLFSSVRERWLREAIASEIRRVLRPGGRLVVYDIRYPSPGNANVLPISLAEFESMFRGWTRYSRTLTVIPPLARTRLAASHRRYRLLSRFPPLRSHLGVVLIKPESPK